MDLKIDALVSNTKSRGENFILFAYKHLIDLLNSDKVLTENSMKILIVKSK